ncbi:unnamed protein product [Prunus armeniaca]|uniref:Uncharacterized protein n=1 Tax=Prunus armeniaca TaxID=36596 RepID=A0A6J5WSZ4_PRUAR|nr:unnamed protein product [Prunus armeniaca]
MFGNPDLEPITRSYGPATLFANLSSSSICRKTLMFPITCRAFPRVVGWLGWLEWLGLVGCGRGQSWERAPKSKALFLRSLSMRPSKGALGHWDAKNLYFLGISLISDFLI